MDESPHSGRGFSEYYLNITLFTAESIVEPKTVAEDNNNYKQIHLSYTANITENIFMNRKYIDDKIVCYEAKSFIDPRSLSYGSYTQSYWRMSRELVASCRST